MDVTYRQVSIPYPNAGANKVVSGFLLIFFPRTSIRTFAVSAMESTYRGTDRQKRENAILKILRACGSEWNAKLGGVQCCADIIES